ncbi:MAG: DUF1294 domain-containing protein [Erysipelotrichales bacterium]|nr:DUF1294 domain-containing protein [Erysipelotrichales bacterium]
MVGFMFFFLIIVNFISFFLMRRDKKVTLEDENQSIKEKVLFTFAIFGGGLGTFTAMHLLKHKNEEAKFYYGIPVLILVSNLAIVSIFIANNLVDLSLGTPLFILINGLIIVGCIAILRIIE